MKWMLTILMMLWASVAVADYDTLGCTTKHGATLCGPDEHAGTFETVGANDWYIHKIVVAVICDANSLPHITGGVYSISGAYDLTRLATTDAPTIPKNDPLGDWVTLTIVGDSVLVSAGTQVAFIYNIEDKGLTDEIGLYNTGGGDLAADSGFWEGSHTYPDIPASESYGSAFVNDVSVYALGYEQVAAGSTSGRRRRILLGGN